MFKLTKNWLLFKIILFVFVTILFLTINSYHIMAIENEDTNKYCQFSNDDNLNLRQINRMNLIIKQIKDFVQYSKQKYPNLIDQNIHNVTKWVFLNGDLEDLNQINLILQQIKLKFI
ncbi:MAG: hypothetical protein Q8888_02005 [Vigna little leaf phytoplasma]|nr:hypothetical protein [Vigna little leaf phytoplasma]